MTRAYKKRNKFIQYSMVIIGIIILIIINKEELKNITDILSNGSTRDVVNIIKSWGLWAPVISIILMVLQAFIAPIPSFLITGANGIVFGAVGGIIVSWTGAMIGAAGTFYLARLLGEGFVRRFEKGHGLMRKVDEISESHGAKVIFIARLLPFVSFDFISYAAGLSTIKSWQFFIATGIGMLPGTVAYVLIGSEFNRYSEYLDQIIIITILGLLVIWLVKFSIDCRAQK